MATKTKAAPAVLTKEQITALVDKIGELKAKLAPELASLEADLDKLKAQGVDRYVGERFEVNVFTQEQNRLDMAAVREKLSHQFITANTTTKVVTVAKVTARMLPSVQ